MTDLKAPETKTHETPASAEMAAAFDEFNRTFSAYRETNDDRIGQLEARGGVDAVTQEKLARIDGALDGTRQRYDRALLGHRRPVLSGEQHAHDPFAMQHKAAFLGYVRNGEAGGLKRLEEKALSSGSGPDGGYLVPPEIEREVLRRLTVASPIRSIASVRMISAGTYKRAFSTAGPATGWVAETDARPQTNSPTLAELSFPAMELYAQPAATQTLLDDAVVDIDQWIADEVEQVFAEQEGTAFVSGNGTGRPKGFLSYTNVANASWTWDKVGYLATGVSAGFAAANPGEILIDLVYALKAGFRQNGTFVMNRKTQSAVRKLKGADQGYLWLPPAIAGAPATLMGFPVVEAEDMPDIGANSFSVAFGDFRRGYLVVDRAGIRILRDPYSAKPYVLFYTTKRVGAGIQDFDAIKLLKFGAS